jgi:hypothetical protein
MKIAERICIILAVAGLLFKLMHWPGAGIMIVLGFSALSMIYFILGWLLFRARKSKATIWGLAIPAGFFLSTAVIGVMFKLQYWPGSSANLAAGGFISLVVIAPIAFFLMRKYEGLDESYTSPAKASPLLDQPDNSVVVKGARSAFARNVLTRALIIGGIAVLLYFTPSRTLLNIQYHDDPEYANLMARAIENPDHPEYWKDVDEYREKKFNTEPPQQQ